MPKRTFDNRWERECLERNILSILEGVWDAFQSTWELYLASQNKANRINSLSLISVFRRLKIPCLSAPTTSSLGGWIEWQITWLNLVQFFSIYCLAVEWGSFSSRVWGIKGCVLQDTFPVYPLALGKVLPSSRSAAVLQGRGHSFNFGISWWQYFFAWTLLFVFSLFAFYATEQGCSIAPLLLFPPSHNSVLWGFGAFPHPPSRFSIAEKGTLHLWNLYFHQQWCICGCSVHVLAVVPVD